MTLAATPLVALEAVALDLEATGLNPRTDRIVEIGAVRLRGGKLKDDPPFRRLVQPGIAIPKAAVAIHGIDQAALQDAPKFPDVWAEAKQFFGSSVLVGHSLGFDLALLQSEVQRAQQVWKEPPWLDVRLLAALVDPKFFDRSLDELASALGVTITDRHSAVGDAKAAASIFCALLPRLRETGIQTVAEAVRAANRFSATPSPAMPAQAPIPDAELPAGALDTYPFRHRVRDVMSAPARWISADQTVAAALELMMRSKISSLFVSDGGQPTIPGKVGIFTERDLLRVLDSRREQALKIAVAEVMRKPVLSVPQDALAYVAIARMKRQGLRHLGVTDDTGSIVGAVSARDLLRLRGQEAIELADEIEAAADSADLARAWGRLIPAAGRLRRDGLSALEIAALISQHVLDLTRGAARIAERELAETGHAPHPSPYALAVLGSAARGESLLAMDQDNALIVSESSEQSEDWFAPFADRVNAILDAAGVPYCAGGVMAKNPSWRGSDHVWRRRISDWMTRTTPQDLLAVDIFFDLKTAYGDPALGEQLRLQALDSARGNASFAKLMLEAAGRPESAFKWSGGFRTENGRIDLKKTGLFSLVSTTRVLAIWHHVSERSTRGRLAALRDLLPHAAQDIDALIEAQSVFLELILDQQLADAAQGIAMSNRVEVKRLSAHDRSRLRTALGAVSHLDQFARDEMFA